MPLTDIAIRHARPKPKPYRITDGGGLFLQIQPSGSKLWRFKYRLDGKEKLLSLGQYPVVTLAEARDRRTEAKRQLERGDDPIAEKRQEEINRALARAQTFGLIAQDFLDKLRKDGRTEQTVRKTAWILEDLAAPLSHRPITNITAPEVLQVLRKIEAHGHHETAHRARSTISRVFRYAIATGRAVFDPVPALRGALVMHRTKHRSAITDPKEFGRLLRAIDSLERSPVVKPALQLLALCFPRPGELRHARWTEIDLEKAIWSIPAERMKMRRPHTIPLAPQAVRILTDLRELTGDRPYIFPGIRTWRRPLSDNTFNAALRSLGFPGDEASAHGFRTTASTLLNESGYWHPDAIERALAHQEANAVRRAYARGEFWDERVRMAAWWADYVDAMRQNQPAPPLPAKAPTGSTSPLNFSAAHTVGQAPSITTSRGGLIFF